MSTNTPYNINKNVKHLYSYKLRSKTSKFGRRNVNRPRIFFREFSWALKKIIFFLVIILLLFLFYQKFVQSSFFKVTNIEINGASRFVNRDDVYRVVVGNTQDKYIFKVENGKIENALKENFLGAKDIAVKKRLPGTVVINVVERVPLAVIYNPKDLENYYLVDSDGYVLGLVDSTNSTLPQVIYNNPLHVGYFIDKELVPLYLTLINSIDSYSLNASSISIERRQIQFYLNDGILVYLSNEKDIPTNISIVSELMKQLNLEGKDVDKIDLRYDKVIVQYDED